MPTKRKANKLVALPKKGPKDPAKVPFETLCAWVFRSGTKVYVDASDNLHIDVGAGSPKWLWETLYTHAERLKTRARCQALDAYIDGNKRKLQADDCDPELRRKGGPWLLKKCDELCELSGDDIGYDDPSNIFAWNCVEGYRETLAALSKKC